MHIRLYGTFTLRAPLSHIGEAISTNTYLVQEPILQSNGDIAEVFCYSGNAWRGQLRDLAAMYMLDRLCPDGEANARAGLDPFHLLFSGGRIGGNQVIDVNAARRLRRAIPIVALFGGGVGNQILGGQMCVSNCYPVCAEAARVLPTGLADKAAQISYRGLTFEKSFTRRDDTKHDHTRNYLDTAALTDESGTARRDGPADQMRMTSELLVAGAELYTEIELVDVDEVQLGALVSAVHRFARQPHIGGQVGRGHGRVRLQYRMLDMDSGADNDFIRVDYGPGQLFRRAEAAKEAYDEHLRAQYDAYIANNQGDISALLEVG